MTLYRPSAAEISLARSVAIDSTADVSRIASERVAGIAEVKAAAAARDLQRASRGGKVALSETAKLAARASLRALRAIEEKELAGLARSRQAISASIGSEASAYGRVVDKSGKGKPRVKVDLVGEDGKHLAHSTTDADGYFAVHASGDVKAEVLLVIGEGATAQKYAVTRNGRLLPLRPIIAREGVPGSAAADFFDDGAGDVRPNPPNPGKG